MVLDRWDLHQKMTLYALLFDYMAITLRNGVNVGPKINFKTLTFN